MNEYDRVRRAVESAGARTARERAAIYKGLMAEVSAAVAAAPRHARKEASQRPRAMGVAIRAYETDVLAGTVRDWSPEKEPAVDAPDAPDPAADTVIQRAPPAPALSRLRNLLALTGRHLTLLTRAGPAAAAWMVIEPLLQIGIIIGIYLLLGHTSIMDMPPLAFAAVGTAPWFMFRMAYIRVAVPAIETGLILIPRIHGIDILASRALAYCLIYSAAGLVLLGLIGLAGVGAGVERPLDVLATWGCVLGLAFGFGLTLRGLIGYVPFLQRATPWFARILFYTSGILFVTEQLPEFIARPLLFNPLLNAIQHLRSAYFVTYESYEASLTYALVWAGVLVTTGLVLEAAKGSRT